MCAIVHAISDNALMTNRVTSHDSCARASLSMVWTDISKAHLSDDGSGIASARGQDLSHVA